MTEFPKDTNCSSVAFQRRVGMFLAELNRIEYCTEDVGNG